MDWERSSPGEFDDAETEMLQPQEPALKRSSIGTFIAFVIGAGMGSSLVWAALRTPLTEQGVDYNGDGKLDERVFYAGNMFDRIEMDRTRMARWMPSITTIGTA